jgi:glycosyltransferase involved in cell wall biosynthesis
VITGKRPALPPWARARLAAVRDRARSPRRSGTELAGTKVLARLKLLTAQRRYDDAVALAEENLQRYSQDVVWLRQAVSTFAQVGAITPHRRAARMLATADPDPGLDDQAAKVDGRWRETSADWRPEVSGPPEVLGATSPDAVLHLLKISLPYRQSGYSLRSKYTVEEQLKTGLQPVVLTALGFPRQVGISDFPTEDEIGGVRYLRLDAGPEYDADRPLDRYLQDYVDAAAPVVRAEKPAIIHAHSGHRGYEAALVGVALGRHFGIPVVYEMRGFFESLWTSDTAWSERSEIYRRRRDTENRCMAEADAVVTLSESMRAEIVDRDISADKVHVVPNGVDIEAFQPRARTPELVAKFGLTDTFTFGYVSNLDHFREGQELLIEAAVELRRRGIRATALIIGDGRRRTELESLARRLRADDSVIFTGSVPHDEVLDYYALLDVFVIPRVDERAARLVTPLKPFEAMAAGVPLVTSDLAALREVTGDGQRGRYFPAGDAAGLADVLAQLHADPAARAAMAQRAREWVVAERQWSANGKRYADIYARVLRERSG